MANPLGFNFSVFLRKEGDEASATKAAAEAVAKGLDPAEGLTCIGVCGGIRSKWILKSTSIDSVARSVNPHV